MLMIADLKPIYRFIKIPVSCFTILMYITKSKLQVFGKHKDTYYIIRDYLPEQLPRMFYTG